MTDLIIILHGITEAFQMVYDMPINAYIWALYRHVIYHWKALDLSILMMLFYPAC